MPLPTTVKDLESVAEPLREYYSPIDPNDESAGFSLQTDRSQEKGTVREFRERNKDLMGQVESFQSQLKAFGGHDPETVTRAMAALKQVEDSEEQKLILDGKYDEVVQRRTEAMRTQYTGQIEAQNNAFRELEQSNAELKNQLAEYRVGELVSKGIETAGVRVRNGAMPLVLQQTRNTFGLDEKGEPVVKTGNKYGPSGNPLTIPEYIESLVTSTPFLFEGSSGGGAEGSDSKGKRKLEIRGDDPTAFSKVGIESIAKGETTVTG